MARNGLSFRRRSTIRLRVENSTMVGDTYMTAGTARLELRAYKAARPQNVRVDMPASWNLLPAAHPFGLLQARQWLDSPTARADSQNVSLNDMAINSRCATGYPSKTKVSTFIWRSLKGFKTPSWPFFSQPASGTASQYNGRRGYVEPSRKRQNLSFDIQCPDQGRCHPHVQTFPRLTFPDPS